MFTRLTFATTFALLSATTMFAASLPPQASSRIPCNWISGTALEQLWNWLGFSC